MTTKDNEIAAETSKSYKCENCNKPHNDRAGLWRHKKKCSPPEKAPEKVAEKAIESSVKELIMMLMKDNQELKTMMVEIIKNGTHVETRS